MTPRRIHDGADSSRTPSAGRAMKPRPFDYVRPERWTRRWRAGRARRRRARAGRRQSLMAMLNLRAGRCRRAGRHRPHAGTRCDPRSWRQDRGRRRGDAEQADGLARACRPSCRCSPPRCPIVGHFQTRNKGTVCGSIAHADPSSEIPLSLAVLEGEVVLRSRAARACSPAADFQHDMLSTACEPDELITAVRFPVARSRGAAFREVARRHGDFAIIAVAAMVDGTRHDAARRRRHGGQARRCGAFRSTAASRTRSSNWPGNSKATRTCTPRPRMRRDLLRRLAPVVIAEAQKCAA